MAFTLVGVLTLAAATVPAAAAPSDSNSSAAATPGVQASDGVSSSGLEAYEVQIDPGQAQELRGDGVDVTVRPAPGESGELVAEIVATPVEAAKLRDRGLDLQPVGAAAARQAPRQAPQTTPEPGPDGVYRSYSEPGGIADELRTLADEHPRLVKLVSIGTTVQGQEILAVKVTRGARVLPDGLKPASLYTSTQHAREWISTEVNRRLLHAMVDGYGNDDEITRLLRRNEFWFVPVLNPDGYDYTFTEGNRLWRKNLADNDGDGAITPADGIDLNRNLPYRWGYDNEGSSPEPASGVYRGPAPGSEPETQALDGLMDRIGFSFLVNYHSAAELLLYGVGWQVATPSPDDLVAEALVGTDEQPAVPGFDPDISAELYTTNGETTNHAQAIHDIVAFTPELTTCQTASASDPDDEWEPQDCQSGFNFPDDEALIQAEFEKNIPYALDIARSTAHPDDPESHLGLEAPAFDVDAFDVSTGGPQTVQVTARRSLGPVFARYRVNGGRPAYVQASEWDGGERYGEDFDVLYRRMRAEIPGVEPGDEVEVRFDAFRRGFRRSEPFTYTAASETGNRVLVIANEDYDGFAPVQDADGPKYLSAYTDALDANGIGYDVWDLDAQGVPHPLGVLDHYDAVVWYTGDNRITQDESDANIAGYPELGVADAQHFTTIAVRDFLNEGGRLFHTGEHTGYLGPFGALFYGDGADPTAPCEVESIGAVSSQCLAFSDDFFQYWLGGYDREPVGTVETVTATGTPLTPGPITVAPSDDAGDDTDGDDPGRQDDAGGFVVTSEILPPDQFPQFTSSRAAEYASQGPQPFQPIEGDWYAGALHADSTYQRLSRTVNLTGASTGELAFQISYDTEEDYDYAIVEARTVGRADWTTLPDLEGGTTPDPGSACSAGLYEGLHPFLYRYLTYDGDTGTCQPTGTTGEWNAFNGDSGGWQQARVDLSGFAGSVVEVVITYVTDQGSGGTGVFVDDTAVTVDGEVVDAEGFEDGLGAWRVRGSAPGSPRNSSDWQRAQSLVPSAAAAVTTEDTVTFGFGFEAISTPEERARVMGEVMAYLLPEGAGTDSP